MCGFHHRLLHEGAYHLGLAGDPAGTHAGFAFLAPDGRPIPPRPAPAALAGRPAVAVDPTLAAAAARAVRLSHQPTRGEPLHLDYAVGVLLDRSGRLSPTGQAA